MDEKRAMAKRAASATEKAAATAVAGECGRGAANASATGNSGGATAGARPRSPPPLLTPHDSELSLISPLAPHDIETATVLSGRSGEDGAAGFPLSPLSSLSSLAWQEATADALGGGRVWSQCYHSMGASLRATADALGGASDTAILLAGAVVFLWVGERASRVDGQGGLEPV